SCRLWLIYALECGSAAAAFGSFMPWSAAAQLPPLAHLCLGVRQRSCRLWLLYFRERVRLGEEEPL
ncbi:MAG TPA: hypothetical protein PLQ35_04590, partial [bacterium]|nr:hypothetical protein [bacterium]